MPQQKFHPVFLSPDDSEAIFLALTKSGHNELAHKIADKARRSKMDRKYAAAVGIWDEGTFDIDDDPVVSQGEGGAFVMVWQWVDKDEISCQTNVTI